MASIIPSFKNIIGPAEDHSDYPEESNRLKCVLAGIDQKLRKDDPYSIDPDKYWEVYGGADEITALAFRALAIESWEALKKIRNDPYFGRVDFVENGGDTNKPEIWYIGYRGIEVDGTIILDWRAPAASLFNKQGNNDHGSQTFFTPSGLIRGNLILKRHLTINECKILEIIDEIDWRKGGHNYIDESAAQDLLIRELYTRGDPHLQDIVKTIQDQQDRIIRSSSNTVLLINGVAGSGKTSIAYHRVAYLLYPETKSDIRSGKTIVFNPSRLFLSYVKELLPSLGVKDVRQVSFDDWALERMGLIDKKEGQISRRVDLQDSSIQVFLTREYGQSERIAHWRRARLKGSLKMVRLLESYMDYRRQSFDLPKNGWTYNNLGVHHLTMSLSAEEIKSAYTEVLSYKAPFEKQRDRIILLLREKIVTRYDSTVEAEYNRRVKTADPNAPDINPAGNTRPSTEGSVVDTIGPLNTIKGFRNQAFAIPNIKRSVIDAAVAGMKADVNRAWKPIVRGDYYGFLTNRDILKKLGKGILSNDEIHLLVSLSPNENVVDIEDIPALFLFFLLGRGKGDEAYEHIVVDEAQDFSPLQFYLLRMFSSNGSMTITGDIAQGIYAHRGISDWSEIYPIFEGLSLKQEEITQNYRATRELVAFTNEVNKIVRKNKATLAKPFNRAGEMPMIVQVQSKEEMYMFLDADIYALIGKGIKNIGVIGKTPADCVEAEKYLHRNKGYTVTLISSRDTEYDYKGGVVILPVTLAKGIEFEAAMVINAGESDYEKSIEYDGRLLYVAITRALHVLNVYSVGKPSGFFETALQKANILNK